MEDQIYSFVLRGNLAKVAMERTELLGRSNNSNYIDSEIAEHLSIDLLFFQQRFRVYPDGTVENADMRIIPCSISSQENVNDFKPTPKDADGAAALLARLDKLNAQFEKAFAKTGVTAVSPYPTAWTYAY